VRRIEEANADSGDVDFHDHDGVIEGDVLSGAVVRGDGDLRVLGGLKGRQNHPCRLEVAGEVVVDGSASVARISGRRVRIAGDTSDSRIWTDLGAEIGGAVVSSEVSVGNRTADLSRLARLHADYERLEDQLGALKAKVRSGGRRFIRDYPQVDLRMGDILRPAKRDVHVDLGPFYKAVDGRSPDEVDAALEEFYLRVMVGSLTRANRHYVSMNPSRQKIFLKLIDELRSHVRTVREADRVQEAAGEVLKKRQALLDELKRPADIALNVGGQVGGGVTVRLVLLTGFEGTAAGPVAVEKTQLEARTVDGGDGPVLETTDGEGGTRVEAIGTEGLSGGRFRNAEGRIVWQAVA
jgi:hypothetical protein